jgi:hypothetical protein
VTLVEGDDGGGARVGLTNTQLTDIVAAYLASAAELSADTAVGLRSTDYAARGAAAMFTLQFNLPGSGAGDLAADGNLKLVETWNPTGADRGVRMSVAAMTAAIAVGVHLIDAAGYSRPWELIASWSAGLVTAAAYVAAPLRVPVALIDLEGPTNSFARSFTTMCFEGKGEGSAVADPGWLTAAADWLAAYLRKRVAGPYTFYVATMGGDPQVYSVIVPDTDYQQYPHWPRSDSAEGETFARARALVDAVRYAALTWG